MKLNTILKIVFVSKHFDISSCAEGFGIRCLVCCVYTTKMCNKLALNFCKQKNQWLNFKQIMDAFS